MIEVRQKVVDDMHNVFIRQQDLDSEYRIEYINMLDLVKEP